MLRSSCVLIGMKRLAFGSLAATISKDWPLKPVPFEAPKPKLIAVAAGLLELNGFTSNQPEIPIHIIAEQLVGIPNPTK